jgi:integrase
METMMKRIDAEIVLAQFDYARYFPNSTMLGKLRVSQQSEAVIEPEKITPINHFKDFSKEWLDENNIRWKKSYQDMMDGTIKQHLLPHFGDKEVSRITKGEILKFRSSLAKVKNGTKEGLSPDRINHIMTPLRMILGEAADRFNFTTPFLGIKQLIVPRTDIDPFSLDEVNQIINTVRPTFRHYYSVRFLTGMRTSEIDGLKWEYVDFTRREILVRETVVKRRKETTKTDASLRSIEMSLPVFNALQKQFEVTGAQNEFVFCSRDNTALCYDNVTNRVWYPLLKKLGLKKRRPYQTRHTAATLWLAAGENPEWIARQMGHSTTRMLFTIYSRYVPNLTRRDGSAFENLLANHLRSTP